MLDLQCPEVFRTVLESLTTGICLVDHERKISFWNEGAEAITGFLRQEALGCLCGEFLLAKFHERNRTICEQSCPLLSAMRDGQPREVPAYLHHKAGYPVPINLRAIPIRNAQGRIVGAAESFTPRSAVPTRHGPENDLAVGHGLDAVTRLPDYRFTEFYLLDRLEFASEHVIPFGLLVVKVEGTDGLKAKYGLEAVEAILKVVAHTLRTGLDALDYAGCWTEDQFLAIVASSDEHALLATGERLQRLAGSSAITWWGDPLSVKVSVGGLMVVPGESLASLMARLESAVDQCAAKGGSCVTVVGVKAQE